MSEKWFYSDNGSQAGPFSFDQLKWLAVNKRLSPEDLVRSETMPDWARASDVAGIFKTEGAIRIKPPPPPSPIPPSQQHAPAIDPREPRPPSENQPSRRLAWIAGASMAALASICLCGGLGSWLSGPQRGDVAGKAQTAGPPWEVKHPYFEIRPGYDFVYRRSTFGIDGRELHPIEITRRHYADAGVKCFVGDDRRNEDAIGYDDRYYRFNGGTLECAIGGHLPHSWYLAVPKSIQEGDVWATWEDTVTEVKCVCELVTTWDDPPSNLHHFKGKRLIRIRERESVHHPHDGAIVAELRNEANVYVEGVGIIKHEKYHPTSSKLAGRILCSEVLTGIEIAP